MNEPKETKNLFTRHVEAEAKKDIIKYSDRIGNIIGVIIGGLVVLYFVAHQTGSTGFFTSKFEASEAFFFYGPMIFGIISSALKVLFIRKNIVRPFDIANGFFITIAISWLFIVFPFDFAHFADVLPNFLRFLLQWISNDVARVLMLIGIIVAPIMVIYTTILFILVRRELSKPALKNT